MADCADGKVPPETATFYHSFPHANFYLNNISAVFKPTDTDYQQNLWLYSAGPAVFGGFVFVIFVIHFLVYCCRWCNKRCRKQNTRRKNKTKCACCLTVCIWLSALICSGSIIAGFVFNAGIDSGVHTVTIAVQNVTDSFNDIHNQVTAIQNNLLDIGETIDRMTKLPDIPYTVKKDLWQIKEYVLLIVERLNGVKKEEAPDISDYIKTGEFYRVWVVVGILSMGTLTCLFAIYSSIRQSRCGFTLAMLIGSFMFLLDWVLLGTHLAGSIAMSDLCIQPRKTINFYTRNSLPGVRNVVNYYIDCTPGTVHPYQKYVVSSLTSIHDAEIFLGNLSEQGWLPQADITELSLDLNNTDTYLHNLKDDLQCTNVHQQYEKTRCAVCFPVVEGLSKLLLMSLIIVVFSAVILLLITPICNRIHHKRRRGDEVNTLLGGESIETEYHSVSSDDESIPLMHSVSPPPYEATAKSLDYQFHSCQEDRNPGNSLPWSQQYSRVNPQQPSAPPTDPQSALSPSQPSLPPPRGEVISNPRITIIAF